MKQHIKLCLFTGAFFVLYPLLMTSNVQDYQQAVEQEKQYDQAKGSAAIFEAPLSVNGKDSDSNGKGKASDYFLELREAGGRLRRVGVSEEFWADVVQGDTVTGQVWRDKVRLVKDHGGFQPTATNPQTVVEVCHKNLWKWIGIGFFLTVVLIYSHWYWYKNRLSILETERNDANL